MSNPFHRRTFIRLASAGVIAAASNESAFALRMVRQPPVFTGDANTWWKADQLRMKKDLQIEVVLGLPPTNRVSIAHRQVRAVFTSKDPAILRTLGHAMWLAVPMTYLNQKLTALKVGNNVAIVDSNGKLVSEGLVNYDALTGPKDFTAQIQKILYGEQNVGLIAWAKQLRTAMEKSSLKTIEKALVDLDASSAKIRRDAKTTLTKNLPQATALIALCARTTQSLEVRLTCHELLAHTQSKRQTKITGLNITD